MFTIASARATGQGCASTSSASRAATLSAPAPQALMLCNCAVDGSSSASAARAAPRRTRRAGRAARDLENQPRRRQDATEHLEDRRAAVAIGGCRVKTPGLLLTGIEKAIGRRRVYPTTRSSNDTTAAVEPRRSRTAGGRRSAWLAGRKLDEGSRTSSACDPRAARNHDAQADVGDAAFNRVVAEARLEDRHVVDLALAVDEEAEAQAAHPRAAAIACFEASSRESRPRDRCSALSTSAAFSVPSSPETRSSSPRLGIVLGIAAPAGRGRRLLRSPGGITRVARLIMTRGLVQKRSPGPLTNRSGPSDQEGWPK